MRTSPGTHRCGLYSSQLCFGGRYYFRQRTDGCQGLESGKRVAFSDAGIVLQMPADIIVEVMGNPEVAAAIGMSHWTKESTLRWSLRQPIR
jgi:hypothetical protein